MTCSAHQALALLLGCALLSPGALRAQAGASTDPWNRVPSLPKTCDPANHIGDQLTTAIDAVNADRSHQQEINAPIEERYDNMDMMEKAQRIQAWMMKNPQDAARAMQAMNATGTGLQEAVAGGDIYKDEEFKKLIDGFPAVRDKAQAPVQAEISRLVKEKSKPAEAEFYFPDRADQAKYDALQAQLKVEHDRACMTYLGERGKLQVWLAAYREYLATDLIPKLSAFEGAKGEQMKILMGDEAAAFKPLSPYEAVDNYLKKAAAAFGIRRPRDAQPAGGPG